MLLGLQPRHYISRTPESRTRQKILIAKFQTDSGLPGPAARVLSLALRAADRWSRTHAAERPPGGAAGRLRRPAMAVASDPLVVVE
jgi:hypothetical protein